MPNVAPAEFPTCRDPDTKEVRDVPMRRTIIGISTSSSLLSLEEVNILEGNRPSGTLRLGDGSPPPIVGIRSSTKAGTVPPISSAVPVRSVNNVAGLRFRVEAVGYEAPTAISRN